MNATTKTCKRNFVSVRISPDLFEHLCSRAEKSERSLNKEVTFILKDYFARLEQVNGEAPSNQIA